MLYTKIVAYVLEIGYFVWNRSSRLLECVNASIAREETRRVLLSYSMDDSLALE